MAADGPDFSRLAEQLDTLEFDLSADARERLRGQRERFARLVRGVVARGMEPEAPLLVVVGGGSGAGKSTLVNSLAGHPVAATGVVRPTTRVATLVCTPDDRRWFDDDRVLPDLVRVGPESSEGEGRRLRLTVSDALPGGVALLDTPDIDSVALVNHELADEALDAADVWVWTATSRTYADEVGMRYLRRARDRQALTAVVINQVRPGERDEVMADVAELLSAEGISPAVRLEIAHVELAAERLPTEAVSELRNWLGQMGSTARRAEVRRQALAGLAGAVPAELAELRAAVERELAAAERLEGQVARRYAAISGQLAQELESGLALRAEVLDRWRKLVGGNEQLLKVQAAAGQLGDLVRSRLGGRSGSDVRQVQVEVTDELTRIVARLLEHATSRARRDLEADPAGRDLLERHPHLRRDRRDRDAEVRAVVADWEDHISELIERVGGPRKVKARRLSTALNAVATSAILVLFTLSGGLTGGEVGIAASAAAASQWLLIKLLGERNVRELLAEIGADLDERVQELATVEQAPFVDAITAARPPEPAAELLRLHAEADA